MKRIVAGFALGAWMLGSLAAAWGAGLGRFTLDVQVFDPDAGCCGFSYDGAVRVDLFDAEQDGASLWSETHASVVIDHGFLSLPLGSINTVTPLAEVLRAQSGADLYIQVTLGGSGFVFPSRLAVTSVPYALVCSEAANAQTLQGLEPDAFAPDGHTHTVSEIDDFAHDHDTRYYTRSQCDAQYATITHNHDSAYLGKTAKAADANLLDGNDSSYFCESASCEDLNTALGTKANTSEVYTKTQLDGGQLDTRYYTESECATLFAPKGDTYTKSEVQTLISQAIAALKDCPQDYTKIADASIPATGYYCRKLLFAGYYDEMVKVGDFWVDRYEASVWGGSGVVNADSENLLHNTYDFARNGTNGNVSGVSAASLSGYPPARYVTWFQAEQLCINAGKNLITNEEWQAASSGTPDPGAWPDTDGTCDSAIPGGQHKCNTCSSGPRDTGLAWSGTFSTSCMSRFGAYDMIGNLWEWTRAWNLHGGASSADGSQTATEFNEDGYQNVETAQYTGTYSGGTAVFPAAALRGGAWGYGAQAGVFALNLNNAPSDWSYHVGFRCARR